tara:strand:- start:314 stop:589 length:276 start_codon:yes stop_codon:yes gene_type:complete
MSPEDKIKASLLESIRQIVTGKAIHFIAKTKKPQEKEYDLIAVKHTAYLFTAKEYEILAKDYKFATGKDMPVTLQETLDFMDDFSPEIQDS